MKLRTLTKKIDADFLQHTKSAIKVEMTKLPLTMTYEIALSNFRDEVNNKFNSINGPTRTRRIQSVGSQFHGGRGRGRHGGRYGARGGRFGGRGNRDGGLGRGNRDYSVSTIKRKRNDSTFTTLTDGEVVEFHSAIRYPDHVFAKFRPEDRQKLLNMRNEYKRSRFVQSMGAQYAQYQPYFPQNAGQDHHVTIGQVSNQHTTVPLPPIPSGAIPPPPPTPAPNNSESIMGGRNDLMNNGRHFQGGRRN